MKKASPENWSLLLCCVLSWLSGDFGVPGMGGSGWLGSNATLTGGMEVLGGASKASSSSTLHLGNDGTFVLTCKKNLGYIFTFDEVKISEKKDFNSQFSALRVNPCPAELLLLYFWNLLQTQFPALKDNKVVLVFENIHFLNLIIWLTEHLPKTVLFISMKYYLVYYLLENDYINIWV